MNSLTSWTASRDRPTNNKETEVKTTSPQQQSQLQQQQQLQQLQQQSLLAPPSIIHKFIKVPLLGVNEYKNVLYIQRHVRTGDSACLLCGGMILCEGHYNGTIVEEAKLEAHVRSTRHEKRYAQLEQAQLFKQIQSDRLDKCLALRQRAKRLILPKWRWHVHDLIIQYIDTPLVSPLPSLASLTKEAERRHFQLAVHQLAKYEQMDCLAVLELAIKSAMMMSKTRRSNRHDASMDSAIIIPLVLPFLGKPQLVVASTEE